MSARSFVMPTLLLLVAAGSLASRADADRRYFLQSYSPYLAPAGELELEVTAIASNGQGDSTGTAWKNRVEFEYSLTERVTGAAYLNFVQPPGHHAAMKIDRPPLAL